MYKLRKILSEIKLFNKVTPEIVLELWNEMSQKIGYNTLTLASKYGWSEWFEQNFIPYKTNDPDKMWLKSLDQKKLISFYKDLLKLKEEHIKLNEIKLINQITPEMIEKLYRAIWKDGDENPWYGLSSQARSEWHNIVMGNNTIIMVDNLKKLSPQQLREIYNRMLAYKKKYNL